jgi:hypothetical protein
MKGFRTIILITGILIAGLAFNSLAQTAPRKTKSEKTLYAHKAGKHQAKDAKLKDKHKIIKVKDKSSNRAFKKHAQKLRTEENRKASKKFSA